MTQIQKGSNVSFFHICVQSCCIGDLYFLPGLAGNRRDQSLRSLERKILHLKYVDNFWYFLEPKL